MDADTHGRLTTVPHHPLSQKTYANGSQLGSSLHSYSILFAVQRAILTWGPLFRGHHVSFHVDNQAVCEALNGLSNLSPPVMNLLWQILELACLFDFSFSSIWLSSTSNAIADTASRFQYAQLFNLAPFLNRQPSSKVLQLHGSMNFANIPRPSLFTYSMA